MLYNKSFGSLRDKKAPDLANFPAEIYNESIVGIMGVKQRRLTKYGNRLVAIFVYDTASCYYRTQGVDKAMN